MTNQVPKMRDIMDNHGLSFHNVPFHDDRPNIEDRKTSRSYFTHPKWGELEVNTADGDGTLMRLNEWVEKWTAKPVDPIKPAKRKVK